MAKNNENENLSINLIGTGTVIKGDIKSNGDIRIDGTLVGSLESKGKVVVGPSGSVDGDISCQNAEVFGIVKAQFTVAELITLKSTAKLTGDLTTNKIAIEPGANFSGTCNMNNPYAKNTGDIKNVVAKESTKVETTV